MVTREQATALGTREELHFGECRLYIGPRGGERLEQERWRVNGMTKTWVTRPDHFRVPIKYGLRECHYLDHTNAGGFHLASECTPTEVRS